MGGAVRLFPFPRHTRVGEKLTPLIVSCHFCLSSACLGMNPGIYPKCIAMVPVLLWGSGGWRCVRQPCRNRSQPAATLRNHSREVAMALPLASSAETIAFGGFKRRVTSWCVARVTFCDIPTWHVKSANPNPSCKTPDPKSSDDASSSKQNLQISDLY